MSVIKNWASVNHDNPWNGAARSARLPASLRIRRAMTKVLEKLKGCPEIADRLGIPGT
jgi:hypothetical protein